MMGRPSKYSDQLADKICERIADGESLRAICADKNVPGKRTVMTWLSDKEEFRHRYAQAREEQADFYADEIIEIADNEADTNRARVRIDARKWKASKLAPKKYGDYQRVHSKMEHDFSEMSDEELDRQLAEFEGRP
jgi:leucyl aminopeptidase (aminopeptidase T)